MTNRNRKPRRYPRTAAQIVRDLLEPLGERVCYDDLIGLAFDLAGIGLSERDPFRRCQVRRLACSSRSRAFALAHRAAKMKEERTERESAPHRAALRALTV